MAIHAYVDQILYSPVYVFDNIIDKIVGKNIHFAKIELRRHSLEADAVLMESIKSILKDIAKEEGIISRFLYNSFGYEFRKNKRREQLIYLGSELKTQHRKVKARLYAVRRQKERLAFSIVDLKRLVDSFEVKDMFFENEKVKNKKKFYLQELDAKINDLKELELSLKVKYDDLYAVEKMYHKLFICIPRSKHLHEETHLMLALPAKV